MLTILQAIASWYDEGPLEHWISGAQVQFDVETDRMLEQVEGTTETPRAV